MHPHAPIIKEHSKVQPVSNEHTAKDNEVDWDEVVEGQKVVSNHGRALANILCLEAGNSNAKNASAMSRLKLVMPPSLMSSHTLTKNVLRMLIQRQGELLEPLTQ